jgi:hypothetical protein
LQHKFISTPLDTSLLLCEDVKISLKRKTMGHCKKLTYPGISLHMKSREGQRMFWLVHFTWCCAIKIMDCGSIIASCQARKKALAGIGVLRQQG